jgi:guanylate kinase
LRETWGDTGFMLLKIGSGVMLLLGIVYLIDFLTLGLIKKQRKIAKFYYPIYWVFSILSLSFLYRSAYYTLITNIRRKWWLAVGVATYMIIAFAITQFSFAGSSNLMPALSFGNLNLKSYLGIQSNRYELNSRQYENMRKSNDMIQHVSIQSDIVGSKYLKLFIVHQKAIERLMDIDCQQKAQSKNKEIEQRKMLACYQEFYKVYIDSQPISQLKWRYYQHPTTNEKGIITFISIEDLTATEHLVEVKLNVNTKKELEELKKFGMKDDIYAYIPFWKETK